MPEKSFLNTIRSRFGSIREKLIGLKDTWSSVRVRRVARYLAVTGVVLLVVLIAAGPLTLAFPATCGICHNDPDVHGQWQTSIHSGVRCEHCHADRGMVFGLTNSVKLLGEVAVQITQPAVRETAWVEDESCLECHTPATDEPIVRAGLIMSHTALTGSGYRCVTCHADAAHDWREGQLPQPTMSLCARCHNNVDVSGSCDVCHAEGGRLPGEARRVDAEWSKTHGSNWESMHGMGDLNTCTLCHEPAKCEGCHNIPLPHDIGFGATHGDLARDDLLSCLTCHTNAFCDSCHGMDMPHPEGFLPEHSDIADGLNDPLCGRCHTTANCNECHERHTHPGRPHPLRGPLGRYEYMGD